jgi:hypothetical protein
MGVTRGQVGHQHVRPLFSKIGMSYQNVLYNTIGSPEFLNMTARALDLGCFVKR